MSGTPFQLTENPGPPEVLYIEKVGVLSQSTIKLELVQNSDYFGMEHALDKIISLGWEIFEEGVVGDDRLVFHFGEKLEEVENKLYARDLILDYDKSITYVKQN